MPQLTVEGIGAFNVPEGDAGAGNFCFFDGHVASMPPQEVLDPLNVRLHRPLVAGDPSY